MRLGGSPDTLGHGNCVCVCVCAACGGVRKVKVSFGESAQKRINIYWGPFLGPSLMEPAKIVQLLVIPSP